MISVARSSLHALLVAKSVIRRLVILLHLFVIFCYFRFWMIDFSLPTFKSADNPAAFLPSNFLKYIWALNLWILICPSWLCFDWSMGCVSLIESFADVRILAVLSFWIFFALLACICFSNNFDPLLKRPLIMSVCWLVIPFLPASNLLAKVGFVVAERVLYIPSIGFCLLLSIAQFHCEKLYKFNKTKLKISLIIKWVFVVILMARTVQRCFDWTAELRLYETGVQICGRNAKAHYNLARTLTKSGLKAEAELQYRKAIELQPDYENALNNLANILKDKGDLAAAEDLLTAALNIRPSFSTAWMNLGIVQAASRKFSSAEISYFQALRFKRNCADCYFNMGNLYLEQKRYSDAFSAWQNATFLVPQHSKAWLNLIVLSNQFEDFVEVDRLATVALHHLPFDASLHFVLALSLAKSGRYAVAEKHFWSAINCDSENADYYSNLGVLYHRWGKIAQAEVAYSMALKLNENLKQARSNLQRLYTST